MRFQPFERWVTLEQAPDLHQDTESVIKAVSYSRRKAEPNTGRWFRVVEASAECPPYVGAGTPVMCNLSMLSDSLDIGETKLELMPFGQCAGIRIGPETMAHLDTRHPVIPIGDYVLLVDNDAKHRKILGIRESSILSPLSTLSRGQRTDEQYENRDDDTPNPNRENDGVRMMFSEVAEVGPDVPDGRLERGDMAAFRANVCGIRFDLYGVSYRLVRCSERNSEIVGRVPAAEFA